MIPGGRSRAPSLPVDWVGGWIGGNGRAHSSSSWAPIHPPTHPPYLPFNTKPWVKVTAPCLAAYPAHTVTSNPSLGAVKAVWGR